VDDEGGSDAGEAVPHSLGLGSMREQADAVNADLHIESEVGEGTGASVFWSGGGQICVRARV